MNFSILPPPPTTPGISNITSNRAPSPAGIPMAICATVTTLELCIQKPINSASTRQRAAYITERTRPTLGNTERNTICMPPCPFAALSVARAVSAYFITIANTEDTKSHKTLPAPPIIIPAATPKMFPTPSVPASASENALKPALSESAPLNLFSTLRGCKMKKPPSSKIKNMPVPVTSTGSITEIFIDRTSLK